MPVKKENKTISKAKAETSATKTKTVKKSPVKTVKKDSAALTKAAETVGGILGAVAGTAHNVITSASEILTPTKTAKTAAKKSLAPKKTAKAPIKSKTKK